MTTITETRTAAPKGWQIWAGRVLSALPSLMLAFSASMKLSQAPQFAEAWTSKMGFPPGTLVPIGVLEVVCTILYLVPRTSVLGAILLSAYLGGAVVTHVRVSEPFAIPIVLGILLWGGLFLRDERLRALLPLRAPVPSR